MACQDCLPIPQSSCFDPCNVPDPCQCATQTDASCIFYNLCGTNTNKLYCTGVQNGTSLQVILEAFDAKLCQYVNQDYSRYNLYCLRQKYTISSGQQFAEAISKELCIAEQQIINNFNTLSKEIFDLNIIVNGILFPKLNDSCNLGILLTDSIQVILQKILNILCNPSILPDNSPSINAQNTNTINFTTSGIKNHNISAVVNVSPTFGNVLQALGNGLYVPTPPAQIPQVLSINYATNTISLSNGGGYVILPPGASPQTLSLNIPLKTITISNGNTIDLTPLFNAIAVTQTPNNPQNTNSINITASGTANTTFSANLNIDGTQPNGATVNTHGLYVVPQTPINASDSSTIAFTTSGLNNTNITAAVKLDSTKPNAIVIDSNGLYVDPNAGINPITGVNTGTILITVAGAYGNVIKADAKIDPSPLNQLTITPGGLYVQPASGAIYTANNGLTQTLYNTQLGGNLIKNSSIVDPSVLYDLGWNPARFLIGDLSFLGYGNSSPANGVANKFAVGGSQILNQQYGNNMSYSANLLTIQGGGPTTSAGLIYGNIEGYQQMSVAASYTQVNKDQFTNISAITNLTGGSSQTFTTGVADGNSLMPVCGVYSFGQRVGNSTSTIGDYANYGSTGLYSDTGTTIPINVTNFYHFYIKTRTSQTTNIGTIYGIYQATADQNIFHGNISYYNGLTNASDIRIKENIVDFTKGLDEINKIHVVKYNLKDKYADKNKRDFVGILAQELETILPEAIHTIKNDDFDDFKTYDSSVLLHTLVQAVQQLSKKVDELQSEITTLKQKN